MRFPPAEIILLWPAPNYVDPVQRGPALLIIELTSLSVALICLALRLYVRLFMIRRSWWDDWLMVAAVIFCISVTVCVILETGPPAPLGSWFRKLTWVTMGFVFALMWIFLIALWTQCLPAWHYWDLFVQNRNCIDEWPPLAGQTITTVLTDFAVYILPMPTLFKLRLPTMQRLILIVLFSLGTVVVVAGIMRTYWAHFVEKETYDVTWDGFELWIWTALEANLAVVCGCVPVLRRLLPSMSGSKDSNVSESAAPPTIGSGKRRQQKLDNLEIEVESLALDHPNAASTTDSEYADMQSAGLNPVWSPIRDSWDRPKLQQPHLGVH
ncbi:hypothetical protein CSAL01_04594 [Colletotrichum salicis]|uniref:Rhodopsin domain-containing protein n=1 Tax=Colletotrichum salicis TaxID=1209931 RepID=A0A135S7C8_9PEZI|nr:hypothetical protein CSAL01_04594 [Colletotrichum salicis]